MTTDLGLDAGRVVQIVARSSERDAKLRFGSGYLVRDRLVITAAHVVDGAQDISIRRVLGRARCAEVNATIAWIDPSFAIDLAVLRLTGSRDDDGLFPSNEPPVVFGRVDGVADCEAAGFPLFMRRQDQQGPMAGKRLVYRDAYHAVGTVSGISGLYGGTLEVTVDPPRDASDENASPWEGMSGAAVFAGAALVAIVSEHYRAEGANRITAGRVESWYDLEPEALAALRALLGIPEDRAGLVSVGDGRESSVPAATDVPSNTVSASDTVSALRAVALGVHNAVATLSTKGQRPGKTSPPLTAYLPRPHDSELRQELSQVLAGGPSRLIMLTGESSTGKTRALYEALLDCAPHATLLHPVGAEDLLALLGTDRVGPGCVLWLNDAQNFLYGATGQAVAERLHAVLHNTTGITAVGTLWTSPYWEELTAVGEGNPHGQARSLLTHPAFASRIYVPSRLDDDDLRAWGDLARSSSGDPRLQWALSAGGGDGRVIQHLSGGPELLAAYLDEPKPGPLFTVGEHALITAALDARRLGHLSPLPASLLAQAADGDLPARHRSPDSQWAEKTLSALSVGRRPDGARNDVRGTLRALTAIYPRSGDPASYEPADYLDQHTRLLHAERYGSPSLWKALIEHTVDADDLYRLGCRAWQRGLRTTAIRLWHRAVAAGYPTTVLMELDSALDPDRAAADFTVDHVDLTDSAAVAALLAALAKASPKTGLARLLARDPASHVDLRRPREVAALLEKLRAAGDHRAISRLLSRDPAIQVDLTTDETELLRELSYLSDKQGLSKLTKRIASHVDYSRPNSVAHTLLRLREVGDEQDAITLAQQTMTVYKDLDEPREAARLLNALAKIKGVQGVPELAERFATRADLTDPYKAARLLRTLRDIGQRQTATMLAERLVADTDLTDPRIVCRVLKALLRIAGGRGVRALMARDPISQVDLRDLRGLFELMRVLREAGGDHIADLLSRDPGRYADLTDPGAVAWLLKSMRTVSSGPAVAALLARDPASCADASDTAGVAELIHELEEAGDQQGANRLSQRLVDDAVLTDPNEITDLLNALRAGDRGEQVNTAKLLARDPASSVDLADTSAVALLLQQLRRTGHEQYADELAQRLADTTDVTDAGAVAKVLQTLGRCAEQAGISMLLARNPALHADLSRSARDVADLMAELRHAGDRDGIAVLVSRDPATQARVTEFDLWYLLAQELLESGDGEGAAKLEGRARNAGLHQEAFAPYGREPDGSPSPPWTWSDLISRFEQPR